VSDPPEQPGSGAHHASADAVRHGVEAARHEAAELTRRGEETAERAARAGVHALSEPRWPAAIAVIIAILFSALLPDKLTLGPPYALPVFEGLLLAVLMVVAPQRRPDEPTWHRTLAIGMIAVVNAANIASLGFLIDLLFTTHFSSGTRLMLSAALIWVTNVIAFSLWYWELDGGGPHRRLVARAQGGRGSDFLFPQMTTGDPADAAWRPEFIDYVFVSFTTATAFSPTDTMPLSRWAKVLMMIESLTSLTTIGLLAARAVNLIQ
jgi:hypothetical protein